MITSEGVLCLPTPRAFLPLLKDVRYKGARGGRGSGKSHFFAEMLIERSLMRRTRAVCIREVQKSLNQSSKQLIEDKIRKMKVSHMFRCLETHIEAPHGGRFIFQGMKTHNADSIKSLEDYDIGWVEEAQKLSKRSFDLLRPTIRAEGSELWFSWNPDLPTDPVDDFFVANPQPNAVCITVNYNSNPYFPDVLRTDMEYDRRRDPDLYKHVWLGGYNYKSSARVFRNWRIGDPSEFMPISRVKRPLYGSDFGYADDPTVLLEGYIEGRTLYISREAYGHRIEIDHLPTFYSKIPEAKEWSIIADSARPETISYLNRHGYPRVRSARKGPNSVVEGIEFIKSYDVVIHPECTHSIDEFTNYSYEIDQLSGIVLPKLEDKKNHVIDSARYMLEPVRKPKIGLY